MCGGGEGGRDGKGGHWRKRDDCLKLHTTNTVSNTQYTKITVSMLNITANTTVSILTSQ